MPLADLLDDQGFQAGLAVGAAALAVTWVVLAPARAVTRRATVPVAGLVMATAGVVALDRADAVTLLSDRLVAGLVLLALVPVLTRITLGRRRDTTAWSPFTIAAGTALAAVPGAWVVASAASRVNDRDWIPALVLVTTVLGGTLVVDFDRANARAGLGPVLLALGTFGMYTTLPDTEEIAALVGVSLPLVLLAWPVAMTALGVGSYPAVGLLCWVAAVDGRGRPGAAIGATACLGVLLVEPVVRRALGARVRTAPRPVSWGAVALTAIQAATVAAAARIAGLETSTVRAVAAAGVILVVSALGVALCQAPWHRRSPAPSS
ncbi:MAG: hypothetical protein AMXMBFR46_19830 [Acidimicrobiia bacterium]